ncbi:MAG TPA: protein kinase [Planctomycetaceae bacterium]|nr:protein kinase [Planctomycetaceae bacterium]
MPRIFISYRRDDSIDIAGRIYDRLEGEFGREAVFIDVDAIPPGVDFREHLTSAVGACDVLLAVIGDEWLEVRHEAGLLAGTRRLDDPADFVRIEIEAALTRGIRVIPVLVGQAKMPAPERLPAELAQLAFRNAAEVRSGRDFRGHVERLIKALHGDPAAEAAATAPGGSRERASQGPHVPHRPPGARPAAAEFTFAELLADPECLRGRRIGPYHIRQLLGAGGSGAVYKATNANVGREVCVKVSYPLQADMKSAMAAVSRGIRGVVALNHPHIVKVFDFERLEVADGASFFVVMEFVEGCNLAEWGRGLPDDDSAWPRRLRMAWTIARALDAAHNGLYFDEAGFQMRGVLHGDIKPTNIHVRPNDEPAIADFMLVDVQRLLDPDEAQRRAAAADLPDVDQRTAVFGTPGFMAPEQERSGVVTVQSDVYALGMTLCDLFFAKGDPRSASEVSASDFYAALLNPQTDRKLPGLGALLLLMIEQRPSERPQDMQAVAARLEQIAGRAGIDLAAAAHRATRSPAPTHASGAPPKGIAQRADGQPQWYYMLDDRRASGPVTSAELRSLVRSGRLQQTHRVSLDGSTWHPATKLAGVRWPESR